SLDQLMPTINRPNRVSESSATLLRRMTAHLPAKSPDASQQAVNRPVVISENDVESGMLNAVRTARSRAARSRGLPAANHAAGVLVIRICRIVGKIGPPRQKRPALSGKRQGESIPTWGGPSGQPVRAVMR